MSKINWGRVIGGGLLAGLVINVVEYLVNGLWLAADWAAAMKALGKSAEYGAAQIVVFNLWGFAMGVFAVWLYAAIRPRFGAGPTTAYTAAVAAWVPAYLMEKVANSAMSPIGECPSGCVRHVSGTADADRHRGRVVRGHCGDATGREPVQGRHRPGGESRRRIAGRARRVAERVEGSVV